MDFLAIFKVHLILLAKMTSKQENKQHPCSKHDTIFITMPVYDKHIKEVHELKQPPLIDLFLYETNQVLQFYCSTFRQVADIMLGGKFI